MDKFVLQLEAQLTERRVAITLGPGGAHVPGEEGLRSGHGRAPLARVIQTEVRDPLTDEILFGQLEHGGTVTIRLEGEKLAFAFDATPAPPASRASSSRASSVLPAAAWEPRAPPSPSPEARA